MAQRAYLGRSWSAMVGGKNWFGRLLLLGLIQLIPIFGQMVALGWFFNWAREVAWGVPSKLPEAGFFDGRTIRTGAMVWVIIVLWSLVGSAVYSPLSMFCGLLAGVPGIGAFLSGILMLAFDLALVGWTLLSLVAALRATIYDSFTPAVQVGKAWKMAIHDWKGLLLVFCISLLSLIPMVVVTIVVLAILMGMFGDTLLSFLQTMASLDIYDSTAALTSAQTETLTYAIEALVLAIVQWLPALLLIGFVSTFVLEVCSLMVDALTYHALGLWFQQFELPRWRGMNEPLPFETASPAPTPGI